MLCTLHIAQQVFWLYKKYYVLIIFLFSFEISCKTNKGIYTISCVWYTDMVLSIRAFFFKFWFCCIQNIMIWNKWLFPNILYTFGIIENHRIFYGNLFRCVIENIQSNSYCLQKFLDRKEKKTVFSVHCG